VETVYLKDICNFEKGSTGLAKAIPGKYALVTTGADRRSCDSFQLDTKAVCIPLVSSTGHGHASLKNVHYQEGKFALGSILVALTAKNEDILNIQFLHLYLYELKDKILVPLMSGAANVALSVTKIKSVEIPLPSITRQKEIVIKFQSIVVEENELKSELTHQQALLKKLRQQILQEAIEGKLTQDWRVNNPEVEPASELLTRIQAEKEQLIKDKKLKKGSKTSKPVTIRELNIPDSWYWCKADEIFFVTKLAGFEYTKHIKLNDVGEVPVIRAQNVRPFKITKSNLKFIDEETSILLNRCALTRASLLTTFIGAGIGDVALFDENVRWHLAPNVAKLEPFENCDELLNLRYLNIFLLSTTGRKEIFKHMKATAQPSLSMGTIRDIDFLLPPIQEQKAIVAKVEKLLILCEQLEIQISQNQKHTEQLMQTMLKEAFSEEQS
jgi:type I restriction enzyme, S subunit